MDVTKRMGSMEENKQVSSIISLCDIVLKVFVMLPLTTGQLSLFLLSTTPLGYQVSLLSLLI